MNRIENFDPEFLKTLLEQYKNTDVETFVKTFSSQFEELDKAIFKYLDNGLVDNAEGAFLDFIGNLVNQPRTSDDDVFYRKLIKARAIANASTGSRDDLHRFIQLFANQFGTIIETFPRTVTVDLPEGFINPDEELISFLQDVTPLTVSLRIKVLPEPAFRFDTPGQGFDGPAGFADFVLV